MKRSLLFALGLCASMSLFTACDDDDDDDVTVCIVNFEDVDLGATGYVCDSPLTNGDVVFSNSYDAEYMSWSGYAVSNLTDTVTPGFLNQYSIFGKGGCNGSKNFGLGYDGYVCKPEISAATDDIFFTPQYVYLALSTYAALALRDGNDGYYGEAVQLTTAKANYFTVTFEGFLGEESTGTVVTYMGDYRDAKDFLMTEWTKVDLTKLGRVNKIVATVGGSADLYGDWGFNAPAYFAIDDFAYVVEK